MNWLNSVSRRLQDHPDRTLTFLFVLCIAAYMATIPMPRMDGMLIGSDGVGYYMYVRSLVLDGDLNFANECVRLTPGADLATMVTPTGLIANQYAIGPGLLWTPFFIAGHLVVLGLRQVGVPIAADGYNYIYQAAVCLGSIVYGFLGICLTYAAARLFFRRTALAAVLLIWLATSFIYYQIVEPSMSHMCSFFAVALFLYVWIRWRPLIRTRDCLVIGLAGGLVGLVRQPDATLLALPIIDCLLCAEPLRLRLRRATVILAGFFLLFWVQMAVWWVLYGNPFVSGYFYNPRQGFFWLSPHLAEVLFSTEHGLFLWHPVLLFSALGIACLSRLDRKLAFLFGGGVLVQAYLIASWSAWSQGDSFGGRMFSGTLPILAIGLSAFLSGASERGLGRLCSVAGLCLVFWNALFILQYRLGYISMAGPYTLRELTAGKLDMVAHMAQKALAMLGGL